MTLRTKLALALSSVVLVLLILLASLVKIELSHCFGMACESVQQLPSSLTRQLEARFNDALTQSLLWIIPLLILFVVALLTMLTRVLTKRIIVMTEYAQRIAEGDWNRSVPVRGNDELASLAKTLNYLTTQLNRQELLRKQMIQDMAHELRTPLMTLKSHVEAFVDGVWEPDERRLQSWLEEVERFEKLVASIETLYETDVPNSTTVPSLDIRDPVGAVIGIFSSQCESIGLTLTADYSKEPVVVHAARDDISRIAWNLLDNAVKYTPKGGRISVAVTNTKEGSQLRVTDTGIGIPQEELDNVFERFYRIDKSRNRQAGGSGLGLSIVQQLVYRSGGDIRIDSHLDKGTCVCLSWPTVQ